MRLKVFTASSMSAAMKAVRDALGDDAVIIDVDQSRRGGPVRITAALEAASSSATAERGEAARIVGGRAVELPGAPISAPLPPLSGRNADDPQSALRAHGLSSELSARLLAAGDGDLALALTRLLATHAPAIAPSSRILLVGLPGQGKTLTAARLAARAVLDGMTPTVVTLDSEGAGAVAQLETFCDPLGVPVLAVDADTLATKLRDIRGPVVIDTPGINPYDLDEVGTLARAVQTAAASVFWVHAAGGDSDEASDLAAIFASLGAKGLIASRLDACRRLGGLLRLLLAGPLPLSGLSTSPFVADLVSPPDPAALARRLVEAAPAPRSLRKSA